MNISDLIANLQTIQEAKGDLPVFVYDDEHAEWRLPKLTHLADGPVMSLPYLAGGMECQAIQLSFWQLDT